MAEKWPVGAEIRSVGAQGRFVGADFWSIGAEIRSVGAEDRSVGAEDRSVGAEIRSECAGLLLRLYRLVVVSFISQHRAGHVHRVVGFFLAPHLCRQCLE